MNLKQLEAFLWVVELQSFTKAARQLYMSQPAVSFQIKSLEEDLKVTLFQRRDKKVTLTEAGRLLYPEARQILKHYQKIKSVLDDLRGLKTGHLSVGAGTIPGEYLIPLLIGSYRQTYPGVQASLKVAGSGDVVRWMIEREIDVGITGAAIDEEELECTPWLPDRLVMIAPPGHPLVTGREIHFSEAVAEDFILREPGSGTRRAFEQILGKEGMDFSKLNIVMELGSTRAVITAVQAGLGVSVVSGWAAEEPLQTGKVKQIPLTGVTMERYLYVIKHKQWTGSFAAESFVDFIKDEENFKRFLVF